VAMRRVLRRPADPVGSTTEECPTGSPGLVRIGTLTCRSTDEEHQLYSIEMQDQRLGAYIRSQERWELFRQYSDNMREGQHLAGRARHDRGLGTGKLMTRAHARCPPASTSPLYPWPMARSRSSLTVLCSPEQEATLPAG
jgi:hypothetical protein